MAEKKIVWKKAPKMHITSNTKKNEIDVDTKAMDWVGMRIKDTYICICCGGGYAMVNFKEYEKVRT